MDREAGMPVGEEWYGGEMAAVEAGALPEAIAGPGGTPQRARPHSLGICLSGGGFRAALFHLGALRRVQELGLLSQAGIFSSVSGGSIFAAHLAYAMKNGTPGQAGQAWANWEAEVAEPFRRFCGKGLSVPRMVGGRLWPWNWQRHNVDTGALARAYRPLNPLSWGDMPDSPNFVMCATDLAHSVNWVFEKKRIGSYQAGYATRAQHRRVSEAVAASSCFPPIFAAMNPGFKPGELTGGRYGTAQQRHHNTEHLRICDGGLYDNMGLEPVWNSARCVLVSDGGAPFQTDLQANGWRYLYRNYMVQSNQSRALRKRMLFGGFREKSYTGAYWGLVSEVAEVAGWPPPYSDDIIENGLGRVRTQLDAFSEGEIAVLENHGYLQAAYALSRAALPNVPIPDAPVLVPHPSWMNEAKARRALGM